MPSVRSVMTDALGESDAAHRLRVELRDPSG